MTKTYMASLLLVCLAAGCKGGKEEGGKRPGSDGQAGASGPGLVIVDLVRTNAKITDMPGYRSVTEMNPIVFQAKVTVRNDSPVAVPLATDSFWTHERGGVQKVLKKRERLYEHYLSQKRAGYPDVAEQVLHSEDKSVDGLALPVPWTLLIEVKGSGTHDWMGSFHATTDIRQEVDPGTKKDTSSMYEYFQAVMVPGNGTMTFTFWCRNNWLGGERLTELRASTIDPKGQDRSEAVLRRDAP